MSVADYNLQRKEKYKWTSPIIKEQSGGYKDTERKVYYTSLSIKVDGQPDEAYTIGDCVRYKYAKETGHRQGVITELFEEPNARTVSFGATIHRFVGVDGPQVSIMNTLSFFISSTDCTR